MRIATLTAVMLLATTCVLPAAHNEARAQATAAKPLDIAGVRPGMSAAASLEVLDSAGWTIEVFPGPSWEEAVDLAVAQRLNKSTTFLPQRSGVHSYRGTKGEETISFEVKPTPEGGRVGSVSYRAPQAGRTYEQIKGEVARRYGAPTSAPERSLSIARQGKEGPSLALHVDSTGMQLILTAGIAADREARAIVDKAVNAKIGAVGQSF